MLAAGPGRDHRDVLALDEQRRSLVAEGQRVANRVELDAAVLPGGGERASEGGQARACGHRVGVEAIEHRPAPLIIDRAPVVGVDQAEVPQLGALVDVGHARGGRA